MSKTGQNLEQLRDKPDDELRTELANTRDALFRLQLGQYTNQVTSTAEIQTKRRDVARIMTILRGRAIGTNDAFANAGSIFLPLLGGPVVELAGLPSLAIVSTGLLLIPLLMLLKLDESSRQPLPPAASGSDSAVVAVR